MDVLSRLKLLNALTALTLPAVFPLRSFTGKGICPHEPVRGLNLNCRSISGLEREMPVTVLGQPISLIFKGQAVQAWPLVMGPIGCPKTLVSSCPFMLPSIPEEQSSYLHHGGSLKSNVPHLAVWNFFFFFGMLLWNFSSPSSCSKLF